MTEERSFFLELAISIVWIMLILAFFLAFLRLWKGPSLADRAVALDLTTILAVGFLSVSAVASGQWVFLDAAITLALVAFLGTVAFAQYLEKRRRDE